MNSKLLYVSSALALALGYFWISPHKGFVVEPDGSVSSPTGKVRATLQQSWFWERQRPMAERRVRNARRSVTAGEDAHRYLQAKTDEAEEWTARIYEGGPDEFDVEPHILAAKLIAMGEALEDHAWEAEYLEDSRERLADAESALRHIERRLR